MERYLGALLIFGLIFFSRSFLTDQPVLIESQEPPQVLSASQPVVTQSRFTSKLEEQTESISKKVVYQDDPETEAGEDKILEEGKDGKKVKIIKITFFEGEEYSREIVSVETTLPKDKKILRGTKIVWKTLSTADGEIKYWKKMRVYATHYDSRCPGCNEWTAIGMRAGKGIIAVDPKVILLRSKVYIPGYGLAVAGDTGGTIKGNIIDLGFDDARTAGWSARFVDIYLL
ncbi:G5 domain-containing protein [Candidatus Daviesbacteria bacterium]|nr:G5 domain-containing protein [Candidatus Daviesbacteria bacterium]